MHVRFDTSDVIVCIAGAGSGKTAELMRELVEMFKIYRPEEVAFMTFTRKGVREGIDRALKVNRHLMPEDLKYFQTMHKMCFHESGLTKKNIIEPRDLAHFNRTLGFDLHLSAAFDYQSDDDKMLQRYCSIRSQAKEGIYIHSLYDEERYNRLINAYEQFKAQNNLVDYYDCLIRYLEIGKPLPIAGFLLDEAQDISPLQWEVVMLAAKNAEKIRISGDPAQAIFGYQGAVPATLIDLAKTYPTIELNSTYRLPQKICKIADSIIEMMQEKLPREHVSVKATEGHVQELADRDMLVRLLKKDLELNGLKPHRWFFLFRCNHHIADMTALLEQLLIPYHTAKGFVISDRELGKIRRYLKYREEGYGNAEVKAKFMREHGITDINMDWTESKLIPSERRFVYADYIEKYGMEELTKIANQPPFCYAATTYKVKGGEADNVAVFLDATKQVSENALIDLDGELRVFYVACTRAKESLYVVMPETKHNIVSIWEAVTGNLIEHNIVKAG